jgi:GNAT superfamily N-acetyltransferase
MPNSDVPATQVRKAVPDDVPDLERLIEASVRALQAGDYSRDQIEAALGIVFGVDRQLIFDGTYFAIEIDSALVACGGWSKRKTLFGSDAAPGKDDATLDPLVDAARIRAFFVHPAWSRRGLGSRILHACEEAAIADGYTRLELVATLTGEPLYRAHGFTVMERFEVALQGGIMLPVIRMGKEVARAARPS